VKLAAKRGYRLVGCNQYGYNAFFIENPLGEREIPGIPVRECFKHPKVIWVMNERFATVKHLPWMEGQRPAEARGPVAADEQAKNESDDSCQGG